MPTGRKITKIMNKQNKKDNPLLDLLPLFIGEAIVAVGTCLVYVALHFLGIYTFSYNIITGALLGALVILVNHSALTLSVDREIKKYMEIRGKGDMSDEEVELFTKKHSAAIQNAMTKSFIIRTVSILAVLVLAFVTGWFEPIAAAIPMFAFRPILTVIEMLKKKNQKAPDPSKFVKYDFEEEDRDKKEKEGKK